jgi:chromosome partitioning protein
MLTISCLSQKGGVGKSTLSQLVGVSFAAAEWSVKIADFNLKQKTSVDWAAMRLEAKLKPALAAEGYSSVKQALLQQDLFDLMVIDGRPDSDVSSLEIAKTSDLIIIPTGVTLADLQPQVRFANELRSKGVPKARVWFAINKSIDSILSVMDAREFVRVAGYEVFSTDIPMKTGYQHAQNAGKALTETAFPTLNERAQSLATEIYKEIIALTKEDLAKNG